MQIAAAATSHVNGKPDVSFDPAVMNAKSQIRDDITTVPELNNNWTRLNGYKQSASSRDASVQALNLAATFNAGTKTCSSVACHNGNAVQWGAPNVTCTSCHTSLP
jgi:predicted CxxxxCH...CXXCH cytochrome family protein